jgi:hypothetical protein
MARMVIAGLCVAIGAIGHARADDGDVSHMVLADDGVTLCRHAVSWDVSGPKFKAIDAPTADCWHIDFASAMRTPVAVIALADQSWPKPSLGAHKAADGVSVCAIDNPTQCKSIHLPDADSFDLVATNAERTATVRWSRRRATSSNSSPRRRGQ